MKIGKVNVLKVIGRLTPDEHEDLLFTNVKQLIEAGEKDFLLDLSSVNYINSTGIGSIIQSFRLAQSKGGDLKLLNPSQCVTHIIQVSKLDSIFEVFHDQDAAIATFTDNPADAPKKGRVRKSGDESKE
jgi:anti-sigma B factor antagonist